MIGNLTNDITRLCGEIAALRDSRAKLRSNLAQGNRDRENSVAETLSEFRNARGDMADRTRTELASFVESMRDVVTELKQTVATFRGEFAEDLSNARRAWSGRGPVRMAPRSAAPASPIEEESPKDFASKAKRKKR
jgi:hypothetical protein